MDDELLAWAPKPPPRPEIGLPGYSDFRLVAQGGEGTVYRARQDGLGRDVAVKVLQVDDPTTLARFRRELEITVRLGRQHPHIVTVLDTGTVAGGQPCIVMEFYDLGSLHDRLRERGPLPVSEVIAAGTAVADALAFAHGQGFLHRDVKPQNVLVLPTSYVLADFGIARGADAGHSASLELVSYRHAAPQMIEGVAPAAADDLWSLGSTLFTLLEGVPPFASDNPDEDTVLTYLGRVRSAEPRALTRPDVPAELVAIIRRCLSKDRADRFADAAELRDALAEVGAEVRKWSPSSVSSIVDSIPGVDADATAVSPVERTQSVPLTHSADFGPTPTQMPEPEPEPLPAPAVDEARGTMTGRLADLTVRHAPEPLVPDFGPAAPEATPEPVTPTPSPVAAPPHPVTALPVAAPQPSASSSPTAAASPMAAPLSMTVPPRDWDLVDVDTTDRTPGPDGPPARRRGWAFAVAGLVAVVAGVGIGILANRGAAPAAAPPATSTTAGTTTSVPTTTAPATTTSAAPIAQGGDPNTAPALNRLVDNGSTVEVHWTDPTGGRAHFVLYDVTDLAGKPKVVSGVDPGETSFVVPDLDPRTKQYCFQLVAIGLDDPTTQKGSSARVCAIRN
ncbi:serine/threonine-protein kinase [Actinokineospora xionganensis]|uniref:non-specific serine/threonine protein kinase n=1 Tax=Actinokineospora xionganensis TaxID=2684470 RepID=A0ABR7LA59_9PSEU|nr:serine/threonine-protein kinase [Actinokineospora xionganensis]MBC6449591.1 protein kinase [Actinokineospora xionganensis]